MSQHTFNTEYNERPISILAGWDRPLQGCFMVIEYSDTEEYPDYMLYSNLDDKDSHPPTFDKFIGILDQYGIKVPAPMLEAINADIQCDRGNHQMDWTGHDIAEKDQ